MIPSIKIRPLNILSASSVNLHGITNSNVFHYNLRIRLSPLKSPILRKYTNPYKRCGMYPSISKCNAKRCKRCKHLSTKSTVTSSVNGRQFSIINNSDLDFPYHFKKIIVRYKKIGYNINVMRQTACLAVNPIKVNSFAYLFNCTTVGRTSDRMTVPS